LEGKYPSNKQINVALTSIVESNMLTNPTKQLSSEGRQLVKDLRDVIDSGKFLWLRKNYNEELQNFLYHTIEASTQPNADTPISKDTAKEHGNHALDGLRTLGRLLITNGQFRKLLEDITLLARDMVADGASKATQKIRPNQDRLKKIDEPAEDHTWHETPPSIGEIKSSLKSKVQKTKETAQEGQDGTEDSSRSATGQSDPQETGRRTDVNGTPRRDIDQNAGASAGLQSTNDRASGLANQIPNDRKEKVRQVAQNTVNQAKDYLKEKIPQKRRDQTISRLKKMVVEIQQHEDYQEAINTLISLSEEYFGGTKTLANDGQREATRSPHESNVQKAHSELKTLLENFADGTSMDDMFDAADNLITDAKNDSEFTRWGKRFDKFIRRCLKEDGYILKDELTQEWGELSEQAQYFLNERYKDHTNKLTDEITRWCDYLSKDPDSVAFGNMVQKLFTDLGQDKNGSVQFKPHLLTDVTDVIIPGFFENLHYVPACSHFISF
jgi:Family of unknown function (DUF5923)